MRDKKIYQNIGPLVGKILNFLYYIMKEEKKINQRPKKLYRALVIKKVEEGKRKMLLKKEIILNSLMII